MSKKHPIEEVAQETKNKVVKTVKNRIFDLIAVGIIVAMLALNLGVLELRDVTFSTIIIILIECIPFFLTSILLSINFYTKGTFSGKETAVFKASITEHTKMVNELDGNKIEALPIFCEQYNNNALKQLQENILKRASIKYETFNDESKDDNGNIILPLKVLSKKELLETYSKERVKLILEAKRTKVKGITANVLLGNSNSSDITNIGENEKEMATNRTKTNAIMYLAATLFMTLIGIKDILQWGWQGLLLVAFKLIYILCSSFMNNFRGYNDITINLTNHIARKTDILKQFNTWYNNNYKKDVEQIELDM